MTRLELLISSAALALLAGGVLLWLPTFAPVTSLDAEGAARWYRRGSLLVFPAVVLLAQLAPTTRMRVVATAAALIVLAVAPLRAEPVSQYQSTAGEVIWQANGAGYGSGGGPVRVQVVDGELRGVQLLPTLQLSRKDVGVSSCVELSSGEPCPRGWGERAERSS